MPISLNVVEKPKSINMAPNFIEPLQNLTIKVDTITTFRYYSPRIYDIEYNKIDIKVGVKRIGGAHQDEMKLLPIWASVQTLKNYFVLDVAMDLIWKEDDGIY